MSTILYWREFATSTELFYHIQLVCGGDDILVRLVLICVVRVLGMCICGYSLCVDARWHERHNVHGSILDRDRRKYLGQAVRAERNQSLLCRSVGNAIHLCAYVVCRGKAVLQAMKNVDTAAT